jgi:hypothetical protein
MSATARAAENPAFCELDRQILFRTRFYFDRSTKFAPQEIFAIQIAYPLPHGADLPAVLNFIGQRVSDTRVNFGVQDQGMRWKPFGFCGPAGLERPNRDPR